VSAQGAAETFDDKQATTTRLGVGALRELVEALAVGYSHSSDHE